MKPGLIVKFFKWLKLGGDQNYLKTEQSVRFLNGNRYELVRFSKHVSKIDHLTVKAHIGDLNTRLGSPIFGCLLYLLFYIFTVCLPF
jgi:hypothetical protein